VAFWLAEQVAPGGLVLATDVETDFLASEAVGRPGLEVLRHDVTAEDLPTGFDIVHARWLVEWLPDKRAALRRMVSALRPGGVLLIEEPDFGTIYAETEPGFVGRAFLAAMGYLESTSPVSCVYGRQARTDLLAVGLSEVQAEGRCPIVPGGSPLAADFLRLTLEKVRAPVLAAGAVTSDEYDQAVAALQDPNITVVAPMTVSAWGTRP
jgi:SAM-dependent methyltransferase